MNVVLGQCHNIVHIRIRRKFAQLYVGKISVGYCWNFLWHLLGGSNIVEMVFTRVWNPALPGFDLKLIAHENTHLLNATFVTSTNATSLWQYKDDFTPAKPLVVSELSLDISMLDGWRFSYIVCHQPNFRSKVSWLNLDNAHLFTLQSLWP